MAMLLAMYQKMRLIREKNQATLDLTRFSSKYDRVSKNIERVQKMYTSKIASLDSQKKIMESQAQSIFQNQYGLAMPNSSPYLNAGIAGNQNYYMQRTLAEYMSTGEVIGLRVEQKDPGSDSGNGKYNYTYDGTSKFTLDSKAQAMLQYYMSNNGSWDIEKNSDGKVIKFGGEDIDPENLSDQDYMAQAQFAIQSANYAYQTQYQNCQTANTNFQTNVSIWYEAAKAQLEAEQDEAVEPLTYQQTMWELEKTQAEQKLERIKADLESYKQLCQEETKEQAPKFGLG